MHASMRRLALLLPLLLAACSTMPKPIPVSAPPPPARPTLQQQVDAVKFALFVMVEEERHKLNAEARPLALDPQLVEAAQLHSDAMAKANSFDTMNPDGNPAVNALLADPKFRGIVGENSAAQYFVPGYDLDTQAVARGFLQIWLNSPNHTANLTYAPFDKTGIGIAITGNTMYASAVFATDFGQPVPDENGDERPASDPAL